MNQTDVLFDSLAIVSNLTFNLGNFMIIPHLTTPVSGKTLQRALGSAPSSNKPKSPMREDKHYVIEWPSKQLNELFEWVDAAKYKDEDKQNNEDFIWARYDCLRYINSPNEDKLLCQDSSDKRRNLLLDMALHFISMKNPKAAQILYAAVRASHLENEDSPYRHIGVDIPEVDSFGGRLEISSKPIKCQELLNAAEQGRMVAQYCCWSMRAALRINETTATENLLKSAAQGYPPAVAASRSLTTELPPSRESLAQANAASSGFFDEIASSFTSLFSTSTATQPNREKEKNDAFAAAEYGMSVGHPIKALKSYKKAAELGHMLAAMAAGQLLEKGKNYKEAITFYTMALTHKECTPDQKLFLEAHINALHHKQSQVKLGEFSLNLSFSSSLNNAINGYAKCFGFQSKWADLAKINCIELKEEAKISVSGDELHFLGKLYQDGHKELGIAQNQGKAQHYLELAAKQGHGLAAFIVYEQYDLFESTNSRGFSPSNSEENSFTFLNMAAVAGVPEAQKKLQKLTPENPLETEVPKKPEGPKELSPGMLKQLQELQEQQNDALLHIETEKPGFFSQLFNWGSSNDKGDGKGKLN